MELDSIKFFIVLASELNFSRAADLLNIDQPHLSKHIRRLEKDLGFQLVDRNRRPVQLTPAGKAFLEGAQSLVEQATRLQKRGYRASLGEIGQLAIAINSSITNSVLPSILQNFRKLRPDVKLVLYELAPQEQIKQLLDYQIDIGFDFLPNEHHPDLKSVTILQEPLVIALPESHSLQAQAQIPLQALADESFVLPSPEVVHFYKQIIDFCEQVFGHKPKIVQEATWMLTVLSLVAAGVGVSLLLNNAQNIQRRGVVYRPIKGENPKIQIVALWRRDDSSAVLHEFLQVIKNTVKKTIPTPGN
ncbi:LysR family transcriptional regulator [Scytonema sp. NUACC21]